MHPINSKNFGTAGIAVKFYNGTTVENGYIVKQTGTTKFKVSDGTNTYNVVLATNLAAATNLGIDPSGTNQATIIVAGKNGPEHVFKIYSKQVSTLEGNMYPWSLVQSYDGSYVIEAFDNLTATYAAGTNGGPTVLAFTTAPANAAHGSNVYQIAVSTTPAVSAEIGAQMYLSTSATVLPTTGGASPASFNEGDFGFNIMYPTAGTFYVWVILSDTSWIISNAITIS